MKIRNTLLLTVCVALTILSGVLKGTMDHRWGYSDEFQHAAERVNEIQPTLGGWTTTELQPLEDQARKMLRCTGDVFGVYRNAAGEEVNMTFLVGPAGPLAIHTAEVCYGSSNYAIQGGVRREKLVDVSGIEHEFAVVRFKENRAGNRPLKVYYAWTEGNANWVAPQSPRTAFASVPMLYKIQVATYAVNQKDDAAVNFLKQCLPFLRATHETGANLEVSTRMRPGQGGH